MIRILAPFFSSYALSVFGNALTAIALPLLVLFTTGSALDAGIVAVAAAFPAAVAGIFMGLLVDLMNRRTVAIIANVFSVMGIAILPVVDSTVGLSLGWFIVSGVVGSMGDVPGITAREAMVPAIANSAGIKTARLLGSREAVSAVALMVGPAVAGFAVAILEPITVMWIIAGIATVATLFTALIPKHATVLPPQEEQAAATEVGAPARTSVSVASAFEGLKVVFTTPILRNLVLLMVTLGMVLAATQGMVIPVHFAFQDQAHNVGLVLTALAVGLMVGGTLFASLSHKIPYLVFYVVGLVLVAGGFGTIALLGPVWSILLGAGIAGLGAGAMNSVIGLAFIENTKDSQRGRVLGAQNALLTLMPAGGIGAASVIIEFGSLQMTVIILTVVWVIAATVTLLSRHIRRIGKQRVDADHTEAAYVDQPTLESI